MAGSFSEAIRRRLSTIDSIGSSQSTWERLANARKRESEYQKQQLDWQASIANRLAIQNENARSMTGQASGKGYELSSGGGGFNKFLNSISASESGGNYGAVNKSSGAMGKYQIMPFNITGAGRGWDYEALGKDVSNSQFMSSPQIQEQIAQYKLQQYYSKYGPAGAAIAWYAGPGAAQKYSNSGYISSYGEAGGYPSVQAYVNAILGRL